MIQGTRFSSQNLRELSAHERMAQQQQRSYQSMQSLYRLFQRKYSWYFVLALVGPLLIFSLPGLYFLQQNYQIFQSLAYDVRPELVHHLDREIELLTGFFVLAIGLSILSCYWLTRRLTNLMVGPLTSIEKHMKKITAGDWSSLDFKHRSSQEFQSLSATYSYLYRTLRVHSQKEIETLEKLMATLQANSQLDKNSEIILKNMILTKKAQLGTHYEEKPLNVDARGTSSFQEKRLAS